MKKTLSLLLVLLIALGVLAGCGQAPAPAAAPAAESAVSIESIKTIGDAMAIESEEYQSAAYEDAFVYVFHLGDAIYRVTAPLSPEGFSAIMALDYADPEYDRKYSDIISPLAIERRENLSELIPDQAELDKLVGKTGEELFEDGWYIGSGYMLDDMLFYMGKDLFEYSVVFDGRLEYSEDFDADEAIRPLKVKSVAYFGLGDAATPEEYRN